MVFFSRIPSGVGKNTKKNLSGGGSEGTSKAALSIRERWYLPE
jgi:hypothetical protein